MVQEEVKKTFSGMAGSSSDSLETEPGISTSYPGITVFTQSQGKEAL
jgi:hypothetical protein